MGLEKEKSETSVIMGEDEFSRSIDPFLAKKEKVLSSGSDRDPRQINEHLKVGFDDVIGEPSTTHSFDKPEFCSRSSAVYIFGSRCHWYKAV
ncbi:caveolin-2 isoform X2 [Conger conger]|uniref:caveolin-2 isoform X2 n=1 Tax=Conger conger TaxID=82655 RepID=UPI002A5ADDAF|nr:caveolin-2 isoform X2 [Conger conger]